MSKKKERQQEGKIAHKLGELRNQLVNKGFLSETKKRNLKPTYEDEISIETALYLLSYHQELQQTGLKPHQLVHFLSSAQGLSRLLERLYFSRMYQEGHPEIILAELSVKQRIIYEYLKKDATLVTWVTGRPVDDQTDLELMLWIKENQELDKLTTNEFLFSVLDQNNPYRPALLQEISAESLSSDLAQENLKFLGKYCGDILNKYGYEVGFHLFRLIAHGRPEHKVAWGQKLEQFDLWLETHPPKAPSFHWFETLLIEFYYKGQDISITEEDLDTPGIRRAAATGRLDFKIRREALRYRSTYAKPRKREDASVYRAINRLESSRHPLAHLFAQMGVEAEILGTPEFLELYNLLPFFVHHHGLFPRDSTMFVELAAQKVQRAETLVGLYQRLFDSGLIDLLWTYDHSLHWNTNTQSRKLTIETLAALLLTGYMEQGRDVDERGYSLTSQLYPKPYDNPNHFEWKQGDLIHPEQFMMGAYLFHALTTAQKAYEGVCKNILASKKTFLPIKELNHSIIGSFIDTVLAESGDLTIEDIEKFGESPEQVQLATVYLEFRSSFSQFLNQHFSPKEVAAILEGSRDGLFLATQALLQVFPDYESYVEVDPVQALKDLESSGKEDPNYSDQKRAYQVVASAQQLTREVMHQVHRISFEAEEEYRSLMGGLATYLVSEQFSVVVARALSIIKRFPGDSPFAEWLTGKPRRLPALNMLKPELIDRFAWLLEDSNLNPEHIPLIEQAIEVLKRQTSNSQKPRR